MLNLFVGVIFFNFSRAHKYENKSIMLNKSEERWIQMQKFILVAKPEYKNVKLPNSKIQIFLFKLIENFYFELFIMFCIFGNLIVLGMSYDEASVNYKFILEQINYGFTFIFIIEMVFKLIALGSRGYFYIKWNRFDALVVLSSIVDLSLILLGSNIKFIRTAPQLFRIIRILRLLRVVKLVKKFQGLIKILQTLIYSLPSVLNIGALLFLVLFIFSILGCYLFGDITKGKVINNEDINFKNFLNAFFLLFRCMTGEDWPTIMFDLLHENSSFFNK